jgi:predicted 3-demethylubiquinone-9 3-methyltransferase (glyoxalase superfamily)
VQKLRTCLWFDGQAEEAAKFYASVFKNSKVDQATPYGEAAGDAGVGTPGEPMVVTFELEGQPFMGLNGGPQFKFSEAISFVVNCKTQDEVDYFWNKLSEGGEKSQCGWLKDKFGLSWQVVPEILGDLMSDEDDEKSDRVMKAMLQMTKLDIAGLKRAYEGG